MISEFITRVSVCTLETLTRREDEEPCGFPGARLIWEGPPSGDIEISHDGSSFGSPPTQPAEIFVAVQLDWDGVLPEEGNLFTLEYGDDPRALRTRKVRLAGGPRSATLTPVETGIRVGGSGYIKLTAARKSDNASWFPEGQAMLEGGDRTYYLSLDKETRVPEGDYEFLSNGFLPEVSNPSAAGFLELELEYETGP